MGLALQFMEVSLILAARLSVLRLGMAFERRSPSIAALKLGVVVKSLETKTSILTLGRHGPYTHAV